MEEEGEGFEEEPTAEMEEIEPMEEDEDFNAGYERAMADLDFELEEEERNFLQTEALPAFSTSSTRSGIRRVIMGEPYKLYNRASSTMESSEEEVQHHEEEEQRHEEEAAIRSANEDPDQAHLLLEEAANNAAVLASRVLIQPKEGVATPAIIQPEEAAATP